MDARVEEKLKLAPRFLRLVLEIPKSAETIDDFKKDSAKNPNIDDNISPMKSLRPPTSPNIYRTS